MKRRAFLGFLGGAAASGPTLAKGIAAEAASGGASLYGGSVQCAPASDGAWRLSRIKELKSLLAGKNPQIEKDRREHLRHSLDSIERYRLDGLHSLSPAHKYRMLSRFQLQREQERRREWWQDELDSFLSGD